MQYRVAAGDMGDANTGNAVLPIQARGMCVSRDGRTILDAVDLEISARPITTVILGPNGAGKSLLVRFLAGLLKPDKGNVTWGNSLPARARASKIGFVFQRPVLLRRTAAENIEFALAITGTEKGERRQRALEILSNAGLGHLAKTHSEVLSGGEQQCIALLRAMACNPDIFLLDEPTSNLDPASVAAIERMIGELRGRGIPVVLITHDLGQARRLADDVIFMHRGRILERTPAEAFFNAPQSREAASYINGEIVL